MPDVADCGGFPEELARAVQDVYTTVAIMPNDDLVRSVAVQVIRPDIIDRCATLVAPQLFAVEIEGLQLFAPTAEGEKGFFLARAQGCHPQNRTAAVRD